jgi:hypothetical protein
MKVLFFFLPAYMVYMSYESIKVKLYAFGSFLLGSAVFITLAAISMLGK